jgi:hypothetical protein
MHEAERRGRETDELTGRDDEFDPGFMENLKLGHDVRFLLVTVGGGAARIGREIARRRLRYVETVAINCDARIQEFDEFDRRVCLTTDTPGAEDTGGSPVTGGHLARSAQPALDRIFEGATFVTIISTLGGGAGTGALPFVLEAAARSCEVLSVFVVKPFKLEAERRAVADRALARLHFVDSFVALQQRGLATLQVLDNETLVEEARTIPIARFNHYWSEFIASHIEKSFVVPAEAAVEAGRLATMSDPTHSGRIPAEAELVAHATAAPLPERPSLEPPGIPGPLPAASAEIELTLEVVGFPGSGQELL